jgi:hypothetical protein
MLGFVQTEIKILRSAAIIGIGVVVAVVAVVRVGVRVGVVARCFRPSQLAETSSSPLWWCGLARLAITIEHIVHRFLAFQTRTHEAKNEKRKENKQTDKLNERIYKHNE